MTLRVTVTDVETSDTETQLIPDHEVLVITTGDCHIAHVADYGSTQVYTIKGRHPSSSTPVQGDAEEVGRG